jgi:hypothetical protein
MAEQDTSPDELQLKKRARRRLVGAAALALFAVIVLPMVMDREPRPLNQDIQVRIPSQDSTGFASKLLPGKPATPMPAPEPKPVEPKAEAQAKPEVAPARPRQPGRKAEYGSAEAGRKACAAGETGGDGQHPRRRRSEAGGKSRPGCRRCRRPMGNPAGCLQGCGQSQESDVETERHQCSRVHGKERRRRARSRASG